MADVKVLCPFCKHIDHRGQLTGAFSEEKGIGFCFYCKKTLFKEDIKRAILLTKKQGLSPISEPEDREVVYQEYHWIPFDSVGGYMKDKALGYLRSRFCPMEYIRKYRFALGLDSLNGRIVMPVYENHNLVYFQARTFVGIEPKYFNPPKSAFGKGKAEVVGFIDNIREGGEVAICEGVLSTIAVIENLMPAVAVLGHSISIDQMTSIIERKPGKLYIIFDPDVTDYECRKEGQKFEKFGIPTEFYQPVGGDPWDILEVGEGKLFHRRRR